MKQINFHYCGHIVADSNHARFPRSCLASVTRQVETIVAQQNISNAYGSLAAGSDIIIAEQLLKQGAKLHLVFPFSIEEFLQTSVAFVGSEWINRFEEVLKRADSITQLYEKKPAADEVSYAVCTEIAIGLAIAESLKSYSQPIDYLLLNQVNTTDSLFGQSLKQLAIWDEEETQGVAGTFPDLLRGETIGLDAKYIAPEEPQLAKKFNTNMSILGQTLQVTVCTLSNGTIKNCSNLDNLFHYLDSINDEEKISVDLTPSVYGAPNTNEKSVITRRAMGQIFFHYFQANNRLLNTGDNKQKNAITTIERLFKLFVV